MTGGGRWKWRGEGEEVGVGGSGADMRNLIEEQDPALSAARKHLRPLLGREALALNQVVA